jgi:hypothetical protein
MSSNNFSKKVSQLASPADYPGGSLVTVRWGQLIRTDPAIAEEEARLSGGGAIVALHSLGNIRGGAVTRANAYFLVKEIDFDRIPSRLKVTRGDMKRIVVIEDGLGYLAKMEREFLRPVIKGPETLESAFAVKRSDLRLFYVCQDKETLAKQHCNYALAYLRRGETVNYKISEDDLKGGIPAERSQVKIRKPYWYCIQGVQDARTRIIFPEHIDRRYVFTFVKKSDKSVVIDKLYLFEPHAEKNCPVIL